MYNVQVITRNFEKNGEVILMATGIDGVNLSQILNAVNISPAYYVEITEVMFDPKTDPVEAIYGKDPEEADALKAAEVIRKYCDLNICEECKFYTKESCCKLHLTSPDLWNLKEGDD